MNRSVEILKSAAAALKKERPGMSLRAVARRLNVTPSYWSKVLRGERALSQKLLPRVVKVLGMDVQQIAELQKSILSDIESAQLAPATGLRLTGDKSTSPVAGYRELGESQYWLLEEWFHIPVLNALTLEPRPGIQEIAERLRIPEAKVRECVRRSLDTGFLRVSDGRLERSDLQIRFPTHRSHPRVRGYHSAMIRRAHSEISGASAHENFDGRLISSVCFTGSKEKLQAARSILEEALYRAANLMAQEPNCDEVYQLNVQLFPLTK